MKIVIKLFIILFALGLFSCDEKKKDEDSKQEAISEIEVAVTEIDSIQQEIEANAKALEDAINELDNL